MQRGIGQHKAQAVLVRGYQARQLFACQGRLQQHNRCHWGGEQFFLVRTDPGKLFDRIHVKSHQGKGLTAAALAQT